MIALFNFIVYLIGLLVVVIWLFAYVIFPTIRGMIYATLSYDCEWTKTATFLDRIRSWLFDFRYAFFGHDHTFYGMERWTYEPFFKINRRPKWNNEWTTHPTISSSGKSELRSSNTTQESNENEPR